MRKSDQIWVDMEFKNLLEGHIVRDKRARRKIQREAPDIPIFGSFSDATRKIAKNPEIFPKLFGGRKR